jgi:hypothetical protein
MPRLSPSGDDDLIILRFRDKRPDGVIVNAARNSLGGIE